MGKSIVQITEELFSLFGGLQNAEKELINLPTATNIPAMTRQKIVSELYLTKHLQTAVDKTIASNEKLARSNKKFAKAMLWLTGALVFVGVVNAIVAMYPTPVSKLIF